MKQHKTKRVIHKKSTLPKAEGVKDVRNTQDNPADGSFSPTYGGGEARTRIKPPELALTRKPFPFPAVAPAGDLASVMGVTARRVRQIAEDHPELKIDRGLFDVAATIQKWGEIISADPTSDDEARLLKAKADERQHLAKRALHLADEARRRSELLAGKVIDREIVEKMIVELVANARAHLLAIPAKVAGELSDESKPAKVAARLAEVIAEALSELAGATPEEIAGESVTRYRAAIRRDVPPGFNASAETEAED